MKPIDRQKICPNCDGRIDYDAAQCTYCFSALQIESSSLKLFSSPPSQENLSALYTPPYSAKPVAEAAEPRIAAKTASLYSDKDSRFMAEQTEASESKNFLPILLLTLAGNLLTLSILQFFFSDHGVVRLEINGSYWFLMLLASLPLFYFGLKTQVPEK
jgi:hypothetical protein